MCYSTPRTTFNRELLRVNKSPLSLLTLTNPTSFCSSSYSLLSRPWRGGNSGKAPSASCVLDSLPSNLLLNLIASLNHLVASPPPSLQAPSPQTIPIFNKSLPSLDPNPPLATTLFLPWISLPHFLACTSISTSHLLLHRLYSGPTPYTPRPMSACSPESPVISHWLNSMGPFQSFLKIENLGHIWLMMGSATVYPIAQMKNLFSKSSHPYYSTSSVKISFN